MTTSQPTTKAADMWNKLDGTNDWDAGLCSCFDECGTCLYAFCCFTPCLFWEIGQSLNELRCLCCCNPCVLRATIRHHRNIEGSGCGDTICLMCCPPCTAQQMYRELKNTGLKANGGHLDACCCGPC